MLHANTTTLQSQIKLLSLWYFLGICPIKLVNVSLLKIEHSDSETDKLEIERLQSFKLDPTIKLYKTFSWRKARISFFVVLLICFSIFLFSLVKLIIIMRDSETYPIAVVIASCCWCIYVLSSCTIYTIYLIWGDEICELLWQWQLLEGQIVSEFQDHDNQLQHHNSHITPITGLDKTVDNQNVNENGFLKSQPKSIKFFLCASTGTIILMFLNVTFFPRFPMYFYSLVPRGQDFCWAKLMSAAASLIMVVLFVLCEGQIEIFFTSFAKSISHCLQILTHPAEQWVGRQCSLEGFEPFNHDISKCDTANLLETLDKRLSYYQKLTKLTQLFNRIFCWPISIYKVFTMLRLCCYVYVLLEHAEYSIYGMLIFPYAAMSLTIKFGIILMSIGNVSFMSKQFLKYWGAVVMQSGLPPYSILERKLNSLFKFGFMCGNLYTIKPHTILTFFSVTLTYVIILLQL